MQYRLQQILGTEAIRRTWLPLPLRRGMTALADLYPASSSLWCVQDAHRAVFAINRKVASRSWIMSMAGPAALQRVEEGESYQAIIRHQLPQASPRYERGAFDARIVRNWADEPRPLDHYFHFGIVRNPFERFASLYANKFSGTTDYAREVLLGWRFRSDAAFVPSIPLVVELLRLPDAPHPQRMEALLQRLRGTDVNKIDGHTELQSQALARPDGTPLDYVGRYEELGKAAQEIERRCGLRLSTHLNKGGHSMPWRDLYTPASVRMVAEIYRRDIEAFGYQQAQEELLAHSRRAATR